MKLSIISFNCMGLFSFDTFHGFLLSTNIFSRINKIGELLAKESVDIVALQEVHTYLILNLLKTRLPDYPYVAYKKYLYGPMGGLVIFSKHPIEQINYSGYKKRGSLLNKSFIAHVIQNGILTCTLQKNQITIYNTYLTPNMDYDHSPNNRYSRLSEAQLKQLAQTVENDKKDGKIVFICGDFNIDKRSHLYKTFLSLSQAQDLFAKYDTPTKHQEYYPAQHAVERLDYIFYLGKTKPVAIESSHLFTQKVSLNNEKPTFLSDHIGLKTTIKL